VDRDGSLIDTRKSVWFQGRAAWTFATAYTKVEQRPEYLQAAKSCVEFIEKFCFDSKDGRMYFQVTKEGVPVRKRRYVFSETFAAVAFAAYSIASNDRKYAEKALDVFKKILHLKENPSLLGEPKFLDGFKAKGHSLCMILINTASQVREAIQDPILDQTIDASIAEIRKDFMKEDFKALLETVGPDGEFLDNLDGRCINPGHCIETAWFILEEARKRSWDRSLVEVGLKILDWSWEWGWDKQHGGILYFRDCLNRSPQEYWHDMKFWWPQNEAVIATLYAYLASGDKKYLEWHTLAHEWTHKYFPDQEHGEWYGYLHRDGSVSQPAKGNFFKGPFHVPRMMIKSAELINEILRK
jgi:N-acylglucosamine 2-epimerase